MDSDRRHELETNDLARKIIQAPDFWKQYGGRILLAATLLVLILLLITYRLRQKQQNAAEAQLSVTTARQLVGQLEQSNLSPLKPDQIAAYRRQLISDATASLDTASEKAADPALLAEASVLRGDLYWTLANLFPLPGASTQPALQLEIKADDALTDASAAYRRVLDSYPDQPLQVLDARFGLAAIAENRAQWDAAKEQYQAILSSDAAKTYKDMAQRRLDLLSQLRQGGYNPNPAPSTQPASAPATQP